MRIKLKINVFYSPFTNLLDFKSANILIFNQLIKESKNYYHYPHYTIGNHNPSAIIVKKDKSILPIKLFQTLIFVVH